MSQKQKFKIRVSTMAWIAMLGVLMAIPDQAISQDSQAWQPPSVPREHVPSEVSIPLPDPNHNDGQSLHTASPIPSSHWPEPGNDKLSSGDDGGTFANLDIPIPDMSDADNPMGFLERVGTGASKTIQGIFGEESTAGSQFANLQFGKVFGSLAIVLGVYFGIVWLMRRFGGARNTGLPAEVVEVMGHAPFGPKRNLQMVRLGSKLLLLINGPEGTHPIGEITDPDEVEYLASLCSGHANRGNHSFRRVVNRVQSTAQSVPDSLGELNKVVRALAKAAGKSSSDNVFEA